MDASRRTFLGLLGLAPLAPLLPKAEEPEKYYFFGVREEPEPVDAWYNPGQSVDWERYNEYAKKMAKSLSDEVDRYILEGDWARGS